MEKMRSEDFRLDITLDGKKTSIFLCMQIIKSLQNQERFQNGESRQLENHTEWSGLMLKLTQALAVDGLEAMENIVILSRIW